jgi:hypothetical protein
VETGTSTVTSCRRTPTALQSRCDVYLFVQWRAPLTDVSVKLRQHGRVLMDFVASDPHCLFAVPEADYRIEGTYRGEMKYGIVQIGTMNAEIKW